MGEQTPGHTQHARQERAYRLFATLYDRFVCPHTSSVIARGIGMLGDIQGLRVLDIGTGTGNLALGLARAGASVTGIDLSPSLLRVAARKVNGWDVRLERMDAACLAFGDAEFDYACTAMVLHEMTPAVRDMAVAEMARVARQGVVIIDYRRGVPLHWATRLVELVERSEATSYTAYQLEQSLARLGLAQADRQVDGQMEALLAMKNGHSGTAQPKGATRVLPVPPPANDSD